MIVVSAYKSCILDVQDSISNTATSKILLVLWIIDSNIVYNGGKERSNEAADHRVPQYDK